MNIEIVDGPDRQELLYDSLVMGKSVTFKLILPGKDNPIEFEAKVKSAARKEWYFKNENYIWKFSCSTNPVTEENKKSIKNPVEEIFGEFYCFTAKYNTKDRKGEIIELKLFDPD